MADDRINCETCGYLRDPSEIVGRRCKTCRDEDSEEATLTPPGLGSIQQERSDLEIQF